jgi:hypothetical protein
LGSCAACWVFCSFFPTCDHLRSIVREALCLVCLCGYARSRVLRILWRRGGRFFTLSTRAPGDIACSSQRAGYEEATEDISTQLPPFHNQTNTRKHSRCQKIICWGRSYRGQSYRRNSCLVPRHMTECRAEKETTTRRKSPWDKTNETKNLSSIGHCWRAALLAAFRLMDFVSKAGTLVNSATGISHRSRLSDFRRLRPGSHASVSGKSVCRYFVDRAMSHCRTASRFVSSLALMP